MHHGSVMNEDTSKPEIVMTYKSMRGSVNTFDQSANFERNTIMWLLCFFVFFGM